MLDTQIEPNEIELDDAEESTGSPEAQAADTTSESNSQSDATTDESSDLSGLYYEIDGEEVSAADIKRWKSGHLMQSDYTRKTQALADDRKRFQTERDDFESKLEMLRASESELNELILGDLKGQKLDELREYDVSKYLEVKEQIESRSKKLSELSNKFAAAQQELADRGFKQLSDSLGWADSEKFESDKKTISEYAKAAGITDRDFQKIVSPAVMTAILEAAKYRKLKESNPAETKKVKAHPKVATPSKPSGNAPLKDYEAFYGKD